MYYDGEYRPELAAAEREAAIEADLELMREFRKKRHAAQNAENALQRIVMLTCGRLATAKEIVQST
jgi:hypothetical protein